MYAEGQTNGMRQKRYCLDGSRFRFKKPWTQQEADTRWEQVRKQAAENKADCDLAASLPFLQKKLDDLQRQSSAA